MAPSYGRAGVVINFVTATGGDVEMLRSIECHYKSVLSIDPLSCITDISYFYLCLSKDKMCKSRNTSIHELTDFDF